MARNAATLAQRIERAITAEIDRRMGAVSNPVLRDTIRELLADSVEDKINAALTAIPPKTIDIALLVQHSMDELASDMKGLKGNPSAKNSFRKAGTVNDNGGKTSRPALRSTGNGGKTTDSGGKTSQPAPRTYDSGSKYGHGGK